MTVFKMRSFRKKLEEHPPHPTAKTAESLEAAPSPLPTAPSGGIGGGGAGVSGEISQDAPAHPDRLPGGYLNAAVLQLQPGRCASCAHWQGPDEYGDGLCPLGRAAHGWLDGNPAAPVMTTALHECAAQAGRGWKARTPEKGRY